MRCRNAIEAGLLTVGMFGFLFGQSTHTEVPEPKFTELTRDDQLQLERQRAVVAAAAQRFGAGTLTRTKADLPVLQKLIDTRVFQKSQTYELQSLGVSFGDVLSSELPLRWVIVTDEYGRDPTLRLKNTKLQINALTMISKRVEKEQQVNLSDLVLWVHAQLAETEQKGR